MKIVYAAKIEHLRPMLQKIREALAEMHFKPPHLQQIELASEEVIVNIIQHAYPQQSGKIEIEVKITPSQQAEISFRDWGPPFNPLEYKEVDSSSSLEERPIGGLGVHLIRQIADQLFYERKGVQNILTLVIRHPFSSQKQ